MWKHWRTIMMLLMLSTPVSIAEETEEDDEECSLFWDALLYVAGGAGISAVAAPFLLTAAGFTSAGIAAHSLAASLMSWTALYSGGAVPAGGLVAFLQSIGATGLAAKMAAFSGGAIAYVKYLYDKCGFRRKPKKEKK